MVASIKNNSEPCLLDVKLEGKGCVMEVDSGSAVSVMNKNDFLKITGSIEMQQSKRKLVVVNGSHLKIFGQVFLDVSLNGKVAKLELIVLDEKHQFTPLIGRNWLDVLCKGWRSFFQFFQFFQCFLC